MMPSPNPHVMQRSQGEIRASYISNKGNTHVEDLFQSGCLKLMMPPGYDQHLDAIALNTAGGLTGGDHLSYKINVGAGSRVRVASQTAERLYRSSAGCAKSELSFCVLGGATLHWLPQETIIFDRSRFARNFNVHVEKDAHFFIVELMAFGRKAMGEEVEAGFFHDRWRIFRDQRLCFADDLRIDNFSSVHNPAGLDHYSSCASLLYVAPNVEDHARSIHNYLCQAKIKSGVSGWNSLVYARLLSHDIGELRRVVMEIYHQLTQNLPPVVWKL